MNGMFCANGKMLPLAYTPHGEASSTISAESGAMQEDKPEIGKSNEMSSIGIAGESYIGILRIPVLKLELPVNSTWSYAKLKDSPCRYTGDIIDNTLVIAAHNYKTHFGNLSLLAYGDIVMLTDANATEHQYQVAEITTVKATDIDGMVNSKYDMTFFTCTYTGEARVVVRCRRI